MKSVQSTVEEWNVLKNVYSPHFARPRMICNTQRYCYKFTQEIFMLNNE